MKLPYFYIIVYSGDNLGDACISYTGWHTNKENAYKEAWKALDYYKVQNAKGVYQHRISLWIMLAILLPFVHIKKDHPEIFE